jgi:phosphoglycolate phosphatase
VNGRRLLVCDLDNTLYDWVGYFVPAFYAMVDEVVRLIGCDREKLLDDFRIVHQRHGDSEQPFALLETQTIRQRFNGIEGEKVVRYLDPAFHAFNAVRKKKLTLHPHVRETLDLLRASGVDLVAHTEGKLYGVVDRLERLNLFPYFKKIYCRERSFSLHPSQSVHDKWLDRFPLTKIVELSHHQMKPNASVLLEICRNEGFEPSRSCYVGDSVARDILMAKRANVFAVWAAYGARHDPAQYELLVRVTHWTSEDVEREKKLRDEAKSIRPDLIAETSFAEVLQAFGLIEHRKVAQH